MNQKLRAKVFEYRGFWHVKEWIEAKRQLKKIIKCKIQDFGEIWDKSFYKMIRSHPELIEVAREFYFNPLVVDKAVSFHKEEPILITLIKDDLYRAQKLLEHYRLLGIQQFAIVDNGSTDGTKEFFLNQKDVAVFHTTVPYTTNRREAWINYVVAYYGVERWYVIVDSDELISYIGMEEHPLTDVIKWAQSNGVYRIKGMMLDMYPSRGSFTAENNVDPYSEYCYFDKDTYIEQHCNEFDEIRGGFRKRMYRSNPLLTKYPVVFWKSGDIELKSHYLFPYRENVGKPCYLVLRHYKFIPNDLEKYKAIARDGNFFNGSIQYKEYVNGYEKSPKRENLYVGSIKYEGSQSLESINVLKKIPWGERPIG